MRQFLTVFVVISFLCATTAPSKATHYLPAPPTLDLTNLPCTLAYDAVIDRTTVLMIPVIRLRFQLCVYLPDHDRWEKYTAPQAALPKIGKAWPVMAPNGCAVFWPYKGFGGLTFNVQAKAWSEIPTCPNARSTRNRCEPAAIWVDGKFLLWSFPWGFLDDPPPKGGLYDPETKTWQALAESPVSNRYRAMVGYGGGRVCIWGGYAVHLDRTTGRVRGGPVTDGYSCNARGADWRKLAAAPLTFNYGMASAIWNHKLLVFGGVAFDTQNESRLGALYDPRTDTWEVMPEAPFDVGRMAATAVCGDRLFLWSGSCKAREGLPAIGALYDFVKKSWSEIPAPPLASNGRCLCSAKAVGNKVVLWGGWNGRDDHTPFMKDGAILDLATMKWTKIADFPSSVPQGLHPGW